MGAYNARQYRADFKSRLSPGSLILLAALLVLFIVPSFVTLPDAKAVTTTNCSTVNGVPTAVCTNSSGGVANSWAMQRKVFFASGFWWIFYGANVGGVAGIYYQSCPASGPTSCDTAGVWSNPALVTAGSNSVNGYLFDAVMGSSGSNLFYVAAPNVASQAFVWGEINLPATGVIVGGSYGVQDASVSFAALGQWGWAADRSSIGLDASGNLWIALVTASTNGGANPWKIVTYECAANADSNPTLCTGGGAPWNNSAFTLVNNQGGGANANYITPPSLNPATVGVTNYMTLSYIDLSSGATGGPFDIYVAQAGSVLGGAIQWTVPCGGTAAAPTACQAPASALGGVGSAYSTANAGGGAWYSAASAGSTVYVVAQVANVATVSFAYIVGTGFQLGTYNNWLALSVQPSISISGTNAIVSFYNGNTLAYVWYWEPLANVVSGVNAWAGPTNLAHNTEFGVGGGDASVVSYSIGGYNLIGVFWNDNIANPAPNTNRMRFAVISMNNAGVVNYPVSITLSYYEYTNPVSPNFAVTPSNYFTITYSVCTQGGCTGPGVAQYTSSSGASLTINNIQSYSDWFVTSQTSASTNGEKWCLIYGNNCGGAIAYGSSDGLTQSWYYYDQLAQPSLYAIASPVLLSLWATPTSSVGSAGYDSVQTNSNGFNLYPNPTTSQPWIAPRTGIYSTGAVSETVNFVRTRDVLPGCSQQTIYPGTLAGATCSPTTSFGTLNTVPITANYPSLANLPANVVQYTPIALTNTAASPTPANFQQMITVDSASFAPYESSTLQNVEFFDSTGAILPSWLESGGLNSSATTVYWVNLGADVIPAVGSLTVYMGFGSLAANFFTNVGGNTGEAPNLSPSYGQYDNGAVVFSSYWDFAGNSLPAGWASIAGAGGYIVNNGITFNGLVTSVFETTAANYPDTSVTESNYQVPNVANYGGVMLVTSLGGAQYTAVNWQTIGNAAGQAQNGFDIDVRNAGNNFRSFSGGAATIIPNSVTPGISSYIAGGTVNGGDTIEYVNELPSKATAYIATNVPAAGNYYIASGNLANEVFSYNWIRQRAYPPTGVMPTVNVGPATIGFPLPSANKVLAYAPVTLTNSQAIATPAYFQADVNVTSSSPAYFLGTTNSAVSSLGYSGVTTVGTTGAVLNDAAAAWTVNQWTTYSLEYTTGPAAGEVIPIASNTVGTLTTVSSFLPAPDASGDGYTILPISTLTDSSATWIANQFVGDYLEYTSGPASGQWLQITANTPTTIVTVAPKPAPTPGGGDNFLINSGFGKYEASTLQNVEFFYCPGACATTATVIPSWLESGESNNSPNSVYWVNLPAGIPASGGGMQIYIGFVSTATNLFSSLGYVGETATQGPSYGIYDNGPIVFNLYDNFAGTDLNAQWAPTSTIATGENVAAAVGQLGLTTGFQNEGVSTASQFDLLNPSFAAFDGSGNLWVVDSSYNRVVEYVPGTAPCGFGAFCNGMAATVVIGQAAFGNVGAATTAVGLNNPRGIAFDGSGNLWVADSGNNRVVEYLAPITSGEAATLVLGQLNLVSGGANGVGAIGSLPTGAEDLTTPRSVAFDPSGNLWVADAGNNRVLEFKTPFSSTEQATVAIGQASLIANGAAVSIFRLNQPSGIAFSGANLWVVDTNNNRVLEFLSPLTTGESASMELGQAAGFNQYNLNAGNQNFAFPTAQTLIDPSGVGVDSAGNVYVADTGNNRVLEFATPFSADEAASVVLGQTSFTTDTISTSASGSNMPRGVTFDSAGGMWITGTGNNRVIQIPHGVFTNGEAATIVLGQPGFNLAPNPLNLYDPSSATFDSSGNLWVADSGNNRVLEYNNNGYEFYTGESANVVLGQVLFSTNAAGNGATRLNDPTYLSFDNCGNLWVSDTGNNRILEYKLPIPGVGGACPTGSLTTGMTASLAIGQAGFGTSVAATSAAGLRNPQQITFSSTGNLWVADTGNNRVLGYLTPFSSGEAATTVLGQNAFNAGGANAFPAFGGTTTVGTTNLVLQDAGAGWTVNQWVGSTLTYTSGPAAGMTAFITSSTANSVTTAASFSPAPSGAGDTFSLGPSASSLSSPYGIAFNSGAIWVADTGNNRVLEFLPSFTNGEAATTVVGQTLFTTATAASSNVGLRQPAGISFDYWSDLWVADSGNNRVVEFQPTYLSIFSGEPINYFEGQGAAVGGYASNNQGSVTAATLNSPLDVAVGPSGHLWTVDTGNNRVGANSLGEFTTSNGVTVSQTTNWEGIISLATVNPQNTIVEFYGYMSAPNSQNQEVGENTPQVATPTATPNGLYAFGTRNFAAQNWYDEYNAAAPVYNYLANFNIPVTTPTLTFTAAYSSAFAGCFGITPVEYPATTTTCTTSPGATTSTTTYWGVKNTTMIMVNDIPGNPNQRWAASANLLGWTLYSSFTVEPVIPYYLQYGNTFKVQSGGLIPSIAPGITFALYGTQYGIQYTPIVTLSSTVPTQTLYVDAGTIVILPETGSGAAPGTRWENSNNQSQTVQVGTTSPNTIGGCTTLCTGTYYEQYEQYLEYVTSDHTALPPTTVPAITYVSFSLTNNLSIPTSTRIIWIDALTTANVTANAQGPTAYEHWLVPTSSWTITCSNTFSACNNEIPAPAIIYYHQFLQQILNYKTTDYFPSTSATIPAITYNANGTLYNTPLKFTGSSEMGLTAAGTSMNLLQVVANPVSTVDTSATAGTLTDGIAAWGVNQWTGYFLTYTSGPAIGQSLQILSNTATTITTATSFSPAPSAGGGDSFTITTGWVANQWVGYTLIYKTGPAAGQMLLITANTVNSITTANFNPAPTAAGGDTFEILHLIWMDAGTSSSVTANLPTVSGTERWVPDINDGASGVWTVSGSNCAGVTCLLDNPGQGIFGALPTIGAENASIIYDDQFFTLFQTFPAGSPSPPSAIPYPLSIATCTELTSTWCQTGGAYAVVTPGYMLVQAWQTTPFMAEELGNATMVAAGFGTSMSSPQAVCFIPSGACVISTTSANVLTVLNPAGSIWQVNAFFQLQEGITFTQVGIPSGAAQWSVGVYCDTVGGCNGIQGSYADGVLVKSGASTTSALLIPNIPYATYNYVVASPVLNGAGNIRWFATPTSGFATLSVASSSTTVSLAFAPQYLLSAFSDPLWTATITATAVVNGSTPILLACPGPGCSQSLLNIWLLPGSTATITETTNPAQFGGLSPPFIQWTDTGACAVVPTVACENVSLNVAIGSGAMAAPVSETANFIVALSAQVIPSTESAYAGETVTTTVWSFGGIGTGTVSIDPASLPAGVTISFYLCNPSCGAPQPNTFNFPTSTDPPDGAGIIMQVTVAASATVYGAFPITVTVAYSGAAGQPGGVCGVSGLLACPIYTLDIITPQAETIGPSNAYGITTPGQTAITYTNGNWLVFYFARSTLLYNYSSDGKTWNPGGVVPNGLIAGLGDKGVHGYSFAITASGNYVYYVLTSTNNNTAGSAKPGNYFYWNYGTVAPTGVITWGMVSAASQPLCSAGACPIYGAGQPSILVSGTSAYVSIPVLADIKGNPMWLIQLWQNSLTLGVPSGAWNNASPPLPPALGCPVGCPPGLSGGILARVSPGQTLASGVNMKMFLLQGGAIGLVDWIGNDVSYPSVEVYNTGTGLFTLWANLVGTKYLYSCTPVDGGADPVASDYTVYGAQSDVVPDNNGVNIYFAGQNGAPSSVYFNDVIYYAFAYNPIGTVCGAPSGSTSGYNVVGIVQGGAGGIPASPIPGQPWHITLAYTTNSITLGFGEDYVLGSALGTCNAAGFCVWVVLPDSVQKVNGLITGLSSYYSAVASNIGTVWIEQSLTSPTGFVVEFALI